MPVEDDRSIVFPQFFERTAVEVGTQGALYELEGVVLQAVMIAANDFLPPSAKERPCWDRQEAHRYRVIRQGNVIFIRIDEDPASCGGGYVPLDSGAKYAVSTDGRILRRVVDGEPEGPLGPAAPDAGKPPAPAKPVDSSAGDAGPPPGSLDGGLP
ncbi:MAG: hypothetical protein JXB05_06660 [Myxococcaceae bacterium]|nr:hypothetical protein [Myxococcaceae bacterium]